MKKGFKPKEDSEWYLYDNVHVVYGDYMIKDFKSRMTSSRYCETASLNGLWSRYRYYIYL